MSVFLRLGARYVRLTFNGTVYYKYVRNAVSPKSGICDAIPSQDHCWEILIVKVVNSYWSVGAVRRSRHINVT